MSFSRTWGSQYRQEGYTASPDSIEGEKGRQSERCNADIGPMTGG